MATFSFNKESISGSCRECGDITHIYMIDEGFLQPVDVNTNFVNGKPLSIEYRYIFISPWEMDRFMIRFMNNIIKKVVLSSSRNKIAYTLSIL